MFKLTLVKPDYVVSLIDQFMVIELLHFDSYRSALFHQVIIDFIIQLVWTQPKTNTVGIQLPINKLCDLLRPDIAAAGYCEALTFALVSRADLGEKMGLKECPPETVHVSNPKTYEFQVFLKN